MKVEAHFDRPFVASTHPSFTSYYADVGNPVRTQLRKKRSQIAHGERETIAGVILCDAGCQMMRKGQSNSRELRVEHVVDKQMKLSEQLDFVIWLTADDSVRTMHKAAVPPHLLIRSRVKASLPPNALELISDFTTSLRKLPEPVMNVMTAASWYRGGTSDINFPSMPAATMKQHQVQISSIELARLLAGEISLQQFHERHRYGSDDVFKGFFQRNLEEGRTFTKVEVKREDHNDADLLTLTFGAPDASRLPFRALPLGR